VGEVPPPGGVPFVPAAAPGGFTVLLLGDEQDNTNEATDTIEPRAAMRRKLVAFIRFFMANLAPEIHAHTGPL